ncbi:MAG TPA: hypothetical protein VEF04_12850 [Blastocatellia bacterium]|nr:hypothetical protein [Blastocatellia bacterium]
MPNYSTQIEEKLAALTAIKSPYSGQLLAIYWPAPLGVQYYMPMRYDRRQGYNKIADLLDPNRFQQRLAPNRTGADWLINLAHTGGLGDDTINFELGDVDKVVRNTYFNYGPDCRVRVYRWVPEVELLIEQWWGLLNAPGEITPDIFRGSAALGNRSVNSNFPKRLRGAPGCQAIFGGLLDSQEEINEGGCPYNLHIGGLIGQINPSTGLPFTFCPRLTRAQSIERLATDRFFLSGVSTTAESVLYGSFGLAAGSKIKGNETRSSQPFAVMLGGRFIAYDVGIMEMIADRNPDHPERAARRVLSDFSEGPIGGIGDIYIDDKLVQPQHKQIRLGELGQDGTGFAPGTQNYSLLAHGSMATFGNNPDTPAEQVKVRVEFTSGYRNTRIYSAPGVFTKNSTTIRAWNVREMITNKIWGEGYAHGTLEDQDWIDLAASDQDYLQFTDAQGQVRNCTRSTFTHYFNQAQPFDEALRQACMWGGYSPLVQFNGKWRIFRLDKRPNLSNVPVFRDYARDGEKPNIAARDLNSGVTSLVLAQPRHPRDLTYQLNVSFCDEQTSFKQRTITIADLNYQTDQGRKLEEFRFNQKADPVFAIGITNEAEAIYHAEHILQCGPFFRGGLRTNQPIRFNTWWQWDQIYKLHEYKIIKVYSTELPTKADGSQRFQYYIILERHELPNQQVQILAQAYDETFFDRESITTPPEPPPPPDPPYPYSPGFTDPIIGDDYIRFGFTL